MERGENSDSAVKEKRMKKQKTINLLISILLIIYSLVFIGCEKKTTDPGGGGGGGGTTQIITIKNDTSQTFWRYWLKLSNSTDWGSAIYFTHLAGGSSMAITLPHPISEHNVYDFWFESLGSYEFTKFGVIVKNGMTLTFTNSDLHVESDLPQVIIQNRSGIYFDSIYVRPSSLSGEDWGADFGWISNNSNSTIIIPIPSSNYNVFDIQLRTTDPTVPRTFTKTNVTVTSGMIVTFLSTDADGNNPNLPVIVIQNDTSQTFWRSWLKLSNTTDWGSAIYFTHLASGSSMTITLPHHISEHNVYDFWFESFGDYEFTKYGVTVSNGMTITFTNSDLE